MGILVSTKKKNTQEQQNAEIEKQLKQDKIEYNRVVKLLLLGK